MESLLSITMTLFQVLYGELSFGDPIMLSDQYDPLYYFVSAIVILVMVAKLVQVIARRRKSKFEEKNH